MIQQILTDRSVGTLNLTRLDPNLYRVLNDEGERYYAIDGKPYKSVTTLLNESFKYRFKPKKPKEHLVDPCQRGTIIHAMVESMLRYGDFSQAFTKEETVNTTEDELLAVLPYWKPIHQYLKQIESVEMLEFLCYSRHGYAGTADALIRTGGKLILADWKTSDVSRLYQPKYNRRYFLQTTAYAIAIEEMYGVKVDAIHLVFGIPNKPLEAYEVSPAEYAEEWLSIARKASDAGSSDG